MKAKWLGQGLEIVAGAVIALTISNGPVEAARAKSTQISRASASAYHGGFSRVTNRGGRNWRPSWQRSALQCVPFARENSGIELSGNAGTWWNNADGLYERGARPEVGSILNFRSTGHMRMGHVAVVTNVISPRHIEIDHANWGAPGRISRNIDVVDVSPSNDWTAVRVALNQSEDYGSVYPTYGFIYDRPDAGVMVANNTPMPPPALRSAPPTIQLAAQPEEVAEAMDDDSGNTPRYSGHHRAGRTSRSAIQATSIRLRNYGTPAQISRVSTHGATPTAKAGAHRATKRRL